MPSKYHQLVDLHIKKEDATSKLQKVKDKIKDLEIKLIDEMTTDGLTHAKTPRGSLRINRIVRASAGGDMPKLIAAMERAGKGDLIKETVNGTSLGAWVREFDPSNTLSPEQITQKLPAALQDAIKITEQIQIAVTLKKG